VLYFFVFSFLFMFLLSFFLGCFLLLPKAVSFYSSWKKTGKTVYLSGCASFWAGIFFLVVMNCLILIRLIFGGCGG